MLLTLFAALVVVQTQQKSPRTIAIDESLAAEAHLKVGDLVTVSSRPGVDDFAVVTATRSGYAPSVAAAETVLVGAIVRRGADPSEVARGDFLLRMHLDQLQRISGYGDRVDRFAIATKSSANLAQTLDRINHVAFGFRAYRSRDIAVETSRTFQVVSRFHRAIGLITIVASSVFLLCIMVLKVEERRRDIAALRLMGISRSTVVQSIIIEAALVAVLGSVLGVAIGWAASLFVNWHYQALYRTPLEFSIITLPIVALAVSLSLLLGIGAGVLASLRLVRTPPLVLFGR
ncbi:MAG: FtsX-like permease family protein [Gemmatimonadota bacterium]|nr:FtsX-like permease family protein [Gemmatimonadota bacterium]